MDLNGLMLGGAAIGAVTAGWGYIKQFSWRVLNLFIEQAEFYNEDIGNIIVSYLIDNHKKTKFYDKVYFSQYVPIREVSAYRHITAEKYGKKTILFWNGNFPILYSPKSSPPSQNGQPSTTQTGQCSLTFLRGTISIEDLITKACDQQNKIIESNEKQEGHRFFIKRFPDLDKKDIMTGTSSSMSWKEKRNRLLDHHHDDFGYAYNITGAINNLFFPKHIMDLIQDVKLWKNSKIWYQEKGIPWKKGWLLYGPPGTGKTALIRAFGEDLNLPIFVFDLSQMSNAEFVKAWNSVRDSKPCIVLFEDFDNVFDGRKNVVNRASGSGFPMLEMINQKNKPVEANNTDDFKDGYRDPVSFDTFLNCLDGVESNDGIFTIITTNHVEKIDEALGRPVVRAGKVDLISSRPGRIDRAIELTYMTKEDKRRMADKILSEFPLARKEIETHINMFEEPETPAQAQERCAQLALREFWSKSGVNSNVA